MVILYSLFKSKFEVNCVVKNVFSCATISSTLQYGVLLSVFILICQVFSSCPLIHLVIQTTLVVNKERKRLLILGNINLYKQSYHIGSEFVCLLVIILVEFHLVDKYRFNLKLQSILQLQFSLMHYKNVCIVNKILQSYKKIIEGTFYEIHMFGTTNSGLGSSWRYHFRSIPVILITLTGYELLYRLGYVERGL